MKSRPTSKKAAATPPSSPAAPARPGKRGRPPKNLQKPTSRATAERVVATVSYGLCVPLPAFFARERGTNQVSFARVLAMALTARLDVPVIHIARIFGRKWATAYAAIRTCHDRYEGSTAFRQIWDTLLHELAPGKKGMGTLKRPAKKNEDEGKKPENNE